MIEPRVSYATASDGVRIAWTSLGSGPPLILMPPVPFSDFAAEWRIPLLRDIFLRLAATFRLVQFDGRGTGHSQRDVPDLSFEAMLRDVDAVVGQAGLDRCALLGFSNSCATAIAHAARHPGRDSRLALFGGSARGWDAMAGRGNAGGAEPHRARLGLSLSIRQRWPGWAGRTLFRASWGPTGFEGPDAQGLSRDPPGRQRGRPDRGARLGGSTATLFFDDPNTVAQTLLTFFAGEGRPVGLPAVARRADGLTPRELEVLRLIAGGKTNAEVAHRLSVSVHTVERHAVNLYAKIGARGRAAATAYALRHGLG